MKRYMSGLLSSLTLCFAVFLGGCASMGLPTATTFNERLAVGYGTVDTVRKTAVILYTSQVIKSSDAQNIQDQADAARAGLDIALGLQQTDPAAAETRLSSALKILQAIQLYLASKGPK